MSNKDLLAKIDSVEAILKAEQDKAEKGFKISLAVYGILILVVIFYTGYITKCFEKDATPKNIAAYVTDQIEPRIPELKEYLKNNAKTKAPQWAEQTVSYAISMVPQMEDVAKQQIDTLVDKLIDQFKTEHFPKIKEFCKENLDATFKNADVATDKELAKAVASVLVEKIDAEIDQVVNKKFYFQLDELRKEVDKVISKPDNKLNKKELAEKRVLLYWAFLVNHADVGNSRIMDAVKFISLFMKAFEDMHINLEKDEPAAL